MRRFFSSAPTIVDFAVGIDIGFGLFGKGGTSVFNVGVRAAQFGSASDGTLGLDPSPVAYKYSPRFGGYTRPVNSSHTFLGSIQSRRSFHGIGPSISWDASAPLAGNVESSEFTIDWGANAAILFGRQNTRVRHQTTEHYFGPHRSTNPHVLTQIVYQYTTDRTRSRSTTVPNIGGFAGLSLEFPNAKISLGYCADFFFGAMDRGVDVRKSENVVFYGPFASISVGLGG